jgi:hypothetical protein
MPYKFEYTHKKLPRELDKRVKLKDKDRTDIKGLYFNEGLAIREIARIFEKKCCRRMIQFILFPERLKNARKNRKEYDTPYRVENKDKFRIWRKEYRHYKQKVLTQ